MTDMIQQPHTPTTQEVQWAATTTTFEDSSITEDAFNRWLDARDARITAAAEQRGAEEAIYELTEAIRFTVEYIGNDYLPPVDGWSWFDALKEYRPELAEHFERNPQLQPDSDAIRDVIADQRRHRADRMEGDDD